jgi:hypothetical protein
MAAKKGGATDLTTNILIHVRAEIRSTTTQLVELTERVDRLESRQTEDSIRVGAELLV